MRKRRNQRQEDVFLFVIHALFVTSDVVVAVHQRSTSLGVFFVCVADVCLRLRSAEER